MIKAIDESGEEERYFGLAGRWLTTAPGEETHYHEQGSGYPVVFIHGSGVGVSARANWWRNLEAIGEHYRTIAFDLVGFGSTREPVDAEYGLDAWVAHLVRFLDALHLPRAVLVGNSLGGWIAIRAALDVPDRVTAVVAMGTGGVKGEVNEVLRAHGRPELTPAGMKRLLTDFVVNADLITEDLVRVRLDAAMKPGAEERFSKVVANRDRDRDIRPLDLEDYSKLTAPILLIHGQEDIVVPPSNSIRLHKLIRGSDLCLLSHCGHWSQIERPVVFNEFVTGFVGELVTQTEGHDARRVDVAEA